MDDTKHAYSQFVPAAGLANAHIQTILPTYCMPLKSFPSRTERFELPCGDYMDGTWTDKDTQGPTVILLHGLQGSCQSHYIQSLMNAIYYDTNWNALAINLRGCGQDKQRKLKQYHGGDTEDIKFIMNLIKQRNPNQPISMVGYSLGGNILLKIFGELKYRNLCETGIAISPPFDLKKCALKINSGINSLYQTMFINDIKQSILTKFPESEQKAQLISRFDKVTDLLSFDKLITAPMNGFQSVDEYYQDVSSINYLPMIQKPTLVILAEDDPIVDYQELPQGESLSPHITLECYKNGGHLGFVSGSITQPEYWINKRIMQHLSHYLPLCVHNDFESIL